MVAELACDDPLKVAKALYGAAYHDPDWRWVQGQCLKRLRSEQVPIKWAAATALGDLAMFHKQIDLDIVLPALHDALSDVTINEAAEVSLMLIKHAVPTR